MAARQIKSRKARLQQQSWTTVSHTKPRKHYELCQVEVPPDVIESLTPLEDAVYRVLRASSQPLTSEDIVVHCSERCAKSDIGNVVHEGRLREHIEAENWEEKPRRWRLKKIKVEIK